MVALEPLFLRLFLRVDLLRVIPYVNPSFRLLRDKTQKRSAAIPYPLILMDGRKLEGE